MKQAIFRTFHPCVRRDGKCLSEISSTSYILLPGRRCAGWMVQRLMVKKHIGKTRLPSIVGWPNIVYNCLLLEIGELFLSLNFVGYPIASLRYV